MSRTHLLGAASAAVLAAFSTGALAQAPTTITGGGSTLAAADYNAEFTTFNSGSPAAQFNNGPNLYWASGSGTGQLAFLNDDNTCNSSKVNTGTASCSGGGGANAVAYGASDATLSSTQISSWSSLPFGQSVSGNLIQLPSMGVPVAFPVVNSKVTKNGQVALNDNDLCNIFTGQFSNWNQTSAASKLAPGTITVVFRGDSSGTSFLLLNHLTAVCTAPAGVTLSATTNFATVFPTSAQGIYTTPFAVKGVNYYLPANFQAETGSSGIANYLSDQGGATVTSAIAYLTADYTSLFPKSNATLANGAHSKLVVASAVNATNGTAYTPTVANTTSGLNNALSGQYLTPPSGSALSNPAAYVPVIQTTKAGYPVVGYTTFDFAQCYHDTSVGASLIAFMKDHYETAAYTTDIQNNGFVPIASTKDSGLLTVIDDNILGNSSKNNLNIQNATACKGIGR